MKIIAKIAKSRSYVYSELLPFLFLPLLVPETKFCNDVFSRALSLDKSRNTDLTLQC